MPAQQAGDPNLGSEKRRESGHGYGLQLHTKEAGLDIINSKNVLLKGDAVDCPGEVGWPLCWSWV